MAVLQDQSQAELLAKIAALEAANAALRQAKQGKLGIKIGEKGGLCFTGFGSFPINMYAEQWLRLDDDRDAIRAYVRANKARLSWKHGAPEVI